jgi:PD-(D/E)XK nuclease superfamily
LKLPADAIGVTDILQYRDCPRRFAFGMRRHTPAGEHPQAMGPSNAYGSAVHEALAYAEQHDASDDEAIQHAFNRYAKWLEPADLERMHEDLATYRLRDYLGVRTVAVEREFRVPLFEHEEHGTIYFRGRVDRLYQRLDNPGVFILIDYKSSRWALTEQEVHSHIQATGYDWMVREEYPEIDTLVVVIDQLRHGAIPTRRTQRQREGFVEWGERQVRAILNDDELAPTHNQWCPWCPIMESCSVIRELSDYALAEIAALAPAEKIGRKTELRLEPARFDRYADELERVGQARRVLERFEKTVTGTIKDMPDARRAELGYELDEQYVDVFGPDALRAAHDVLGEDFYLAAGMSKAALGRALPDDERVETVLGMAERRPGRVIVRRRK